MSDIKELPVLAFATAQEFEVWLHNNHGYYDGVWIKMAKKSSGIASIAHDEALDVALCYGWIDSLRRGLDDIYFLQKFTPRRAKSQWSERNKQKVAMLIAAGRMQPSGLAGIERL
ncbi:MAG TPA: hypothetical protein VNX65_03975 [Patescibacteria group bacterium]|jgi:uncharacterized protein YdeI (YjbR/CyaY-like superfamily)|nr:hypothetical protein [Patescibacteria group bacterium]